MWIAASAGGAEVARRFSIQVAVIHMGAARVPEVGPFHLKMTAEEGFENAMLLQMNVTLKGDTKKAEKARILVMRFRKLMERKKPN